MLQYTGSMPTRKPSTRSRVAVAALLLALYCVAVAARTSTPSVDEIAVAELPAEARDVLDRIKSDGPFRYDRDGVVFGNREHQLPAQSRGYYREYTVPTPGVKNRGGRRIVCGGPRTAPHACFYTSDHYQTFRRIRQ
jgi:ribonuclease T1